MSAESADTLVGLGADFLPAYLVGNDRFIMATLDGNPHDRVSERDRTALDLVAAYGLGACAELAFCRYIGAEWKDDIKRPHGQRSPIDVTHNGVKYEVRDTCHPNGNLIVYPRRDRPDVDAWVLVIIDLPITAPAVFRMAGWATRADADELGNPYGSGHSLWIPNRMLRPLPRGGLTRADIDYANGRAS